MRKGRKAKYSEITAEYKKNLSKLHESIERTRRFLDVGFISTDEAYERIGKSIKEYDDSYHKFRDSLLLRKAQNSTVIELDELCKNENISVEIGDLQTENGIVRGVVGIKHESR